MIKVLGENYFKRTIIQLAKNNCMLHRTSDDLGFLVTFDLNDLRNFSKELLTFKTNVNKKFRLYDSGGPIQSKIMS